jgi:hypothetical protein
LTAVHYLFCSFDLPFTEMQTTMKN